MCFVSCIAFHSTDSCALVSYLVLLLLWVRHYHIINPCGAGVSSRTRGDGGGGKYYPLLSQKRRAVGIHGRQQAKARNEKVQMSFFFKYRRQMWGQDQLKGQDSRWKRWKFQNCYFCHKKYSFDATFDGEFNGASFIFLSCMLYSKNEFENLTYVHFRSFGRYESYFLADWHELIFSD